MSMENNNEKEFVSITEAARINNVTRQAIYVAIKLKKLNAYKDTTRWTIDIDDLNEYKNSKYCRSKSTHNGELIFNNKDGYYSVNQTARILEVTSQKIYYATRIGNLKAIRKGAAWVIHISDIEEYQKKELAACG